MAPSGQRLIGLASLLLSPSKPLNGKNCIKEQLYKFKKPLGIFVGLSE